MSYWNGHVWADENPAEPAKPRATDRAATAVMLLAAIALLIPVFTANASSRGYAPTLSVDLGTSRLAATSTSTNYLVTGCGYNAAYGGVTVVVHSPEAISFAGQIPDANGCINVWNFWTQGSGHYDVDAYQTVRKKSSLVASTNFDL